MTIENRNHVSTGVRLVWDGCKPELGSAKLLGTSRHVRDCCRSRFMISENSMGGKWLELLKEIAPDVECNSGAEIG
jgi:hypothetical protein